MTFRFQPELETRIVSAAESTGIAIEEFIRAAIETALRPIEGKQLAAAKDIAELEAMWQRVGGRAVDTEGGAATSNTPE